MSAAKTTTTKDLPQFSAARCKSCGICTHFCALGAIATKNGGLPYLADPAACSSCGLCRDMCPDWAVHMEATEIEVEASDPETPTQPGSEESPSDEDGDAPGENEADKGR